MFGEIRNLIWWHCRRIHPEFPYIDAEVRYAVREYAATAVDILARRCVAFLFQALYLSLFVPRLRISFLNVAAAEECLPKVQQLNILHSINILFVKVLEIMAEELGWSEAEQLKQKEEALSFLRTQMGKDLNKASRDSIPVSLTKAEIAEYVNRFNSLDSDKKGFVSINDIRKSLQVSFSMWVFALSYW